MIQNTAIQNDLHRPAAVKEPRTQRRGLLLHNFTLDVRSAVELPSDGARVYFCHGPPSTTHNDSVRVFVFRDWPEPRGGSCRVTGAENSSGRETQPRFLAAFNMYTEHSIRPSTRSFTRSSVLLGVKACDSQCVSFLIKAGNKLPPATPGKPKKATTFQEFESITSDAWDVGDDDDELLAMAAQNLNIEVVMETANKVIENHSKQQERQRLDDSTELEQREEDTQEETAEGEDEEENEEEDEEERAEEGEATIPEASFASQSSFYADGRLVKSHSEAPIGSPKDAAGEFASLHRQRSLPHRPPVIPLVARMADQNTSGTPAMTEREASRLDKFKQLLAGPNTDLGERHSPKQVLRFFHFRCVSLIVCSLSPASCAALLTMLRGLHGGEQKYQRQQKQMTGLCSKQTTGPFIVHPTPETAFATAATPVAMISPADLPLLQLTLCPLELNFSPTAVHRLVASSR
ncbi:hypothetical protein F2P81_018715 [Scophthalmus maximus]|uniref:Uncharacterized protein n=1 Tax=Scophthalmus maximus TaxID=52904 RepID=A0A6A4SCV4_SCOMX|nr:hypothetical protein F2P81_018715 [Scophthalmus maximus]